MYDCKLEEDNENVYADENVSKELSIKTHYEGLDIAGSRKIHYLRFSLPTVLPGIQKDLELKEKIGEYERPG